MTTNDFDPEDAMETARGLVLRGRALRFVLVSEMMKRPQVTVAELCAILASDGFVLAGRPSKVISDSLRWEIRRGRVRRLGRGVYAYATAPKTTARRIRLFGARCREWVVAVMLGRQPPPTPQDPRWPMSPWSYRSDDPPWWRIGWLWVT